MAGSAVDVLLSSGLLAFARHAGFLRALEERLADDQADAPRVDAVIGTSSGALVGALWAAGHSSQWIVDEVAAKRPLHLMRLGWPWRGVFSLDPLVEYLREHLPATIEELPRPFAAGVAHDGTYRLLTSGPLPEAVAASCAIPWVFQPVQVGAEDKAFSDGGAVDRIGYRAWRRWRGEGAGIVHWVQSSISCQPRPRLYQDTSFVVTPRSEASFLSLGDVRSQADEAHRIATEVFSGESALELLRAGPQGKGHALPTATSTL